MAPDYPEPQESPRDVGSFRQTAALDEPRQDDTVTLEIFTHANQPFDLCRTNQPLHGERHFAGAVARQSPQCVIALTRRREFESRVRTHRVEHPIQGHVAATPESDRTRRLLSIRPPTTRSAAPASQTPSRPARTASAASIGKRPGARRSDGRRTAPLGRGADSPGHRRVHRLLTLGEIACADGAEQAIVLETAAQIVERQRFDPRGRQFERERQPIEASTNHRHGRT